MDMKSIDAVLKEIQDRAEALGLSPRATALVAKLHSNTLRHFSTPRWQPTIPTIRALQKALSQPDTKVLQQLKTERRKLRAGDLEPGGATSNRTSESPRREAA